MKHFLPFILSSSLCFPFLVLFLYCSLLSLLNINSVSSLRLLYSTISNPHCQSLPPLLLFFRTSQKSYPWPMEVYAKLYGIISLQWPIMIVRGRPEGTTEDRMLSNNPPPQFASRRHCLGLCALCSPASQPQRGHSQGEGWKTPSCFLLPLAYHNSEGTLSL